MAIVHFHYAHGCTRTVDVEDGVSVMRAALTNDVEGIIGECGGQAMCATCHVYVTDTDGLPRLSQDEDEMLDCTASPRDPIHSRLGCQLRAGVDFEKLDVDIPTTQV